MVKSLDDLVQPSKDEIIENLKKENKELKKEMHEYKIHLSDCDKELRRKTNDYNEFMISSSEEGRHRLMQVKGGSGIKPLSLQKRDVEVQKVITVNSKKIRLSEMTLNHQMVRILFLEQLYRAFTIIRGESYHH